GSDPAPPRPAPEPAAARRVAPAAVADILPRHARLRAQAGRRQPI
ncbi:MAG: hypothetical protein AVDCRST_MAG64-3868, partial [uncultured Phycisphaerae bacterium]